jgi:hypothetical protein
MKLALLAASAVTASATAAHAGEAACWYEQGVVVVPASIAGLAGDYILDTGAPFTLLHETKGQMAGFEGPAQRGAVRIAGVTLPDRPFTVTDLDARTWAFPTPIAGVIGADVLSAYVVDVTFAPCRVAIRRPAEAAAFGAEASVPLRADLVQAAGRAIVSDGLRAFGADFAIATGADTPVRLDSRLARAPEIEKREEILAHGGVRGRLKAASFGGVLLQDLSAGLTDTEDPALAGTLGAPLLAHWRLRFDFPARQLHLAHEKGLPAETGRP